MKGTLQSAADQLAYVLRRAWQRGVLDLSTSMALVLFLGFLQNLIVARILGPQGLGHLAVVNSVMSLAQVLAAAGVTTSIVRYGAAAKAEAAAWAIFRSGIGLVAICSLAVAAATALLAVSPLWLFDPVAGLWLPVAALALPLRSLTSAAHSFLHAREHLRAKAISEVLARLLIFVVLPLGALFGGFPGAVLGLVLGSALGTLATLGYVATLRASERLTAAVSKLELLRFGAWSASTNVLGTLLLVTDVMCVSALEEDAARVGFYSLAVLFQQVVRVPMRGYLEARFPEMVRLAADPLALRELRGRMRWHLFGLCVPAALALGVTAPFFIPFVFGERFWPSIRPLEILLASHLFWGLGAASGRALLAAGWVQGNFYTSLFAALANLVLNLSLIPIFGIEGAALATSLTLALWCLAVNGACRWHERMRA